MKNVLHTDVYSVNENEVIVTTGDETHHYNTAELLALTKDELLKQAINDRHIVNACIFANGEGYNTASDYTYKISPGTGYGSIASAHKKDGDECIHMYFDGFEIMISESSLSNFVPFESHHKSRITYELMKLLRTKGGCPL